MFTVLCLHSCSREFIHYTYPAVLDHVYVLIIRRSTLKKNRIVSRWSKNRSVQFITHTYIYIHTYIHMQNPEISFPFFFFFFFKLILFLSYVHSFHEQCTCVNLIVKFCLFNTASKPLSIIRFVQIVMRFEDAAFSFLLFAESDAYEEFFTKNYVSTFQGICFQCSLSWVF